MAALCHADGQQQPATQVLASVRPVSDSFVYVAAEHLQATLCPDCPAAVQLCSVWLSSMLLPSLQHTAVPACFYTLATIGQLVSVPEGYAGRHRHLEWAGTTGATR